ncbi:MAG: ABC transporter substrate-binding protein [Calditrichaeota bacterium]|nr:MAG: ABC transporter substrate-binding protein [Calditrichota bacterium]
MNQSSVPGQKTPGILVGFYSALVLLLLFAGVKLYRSFNFPSRRSAGQVQQASDDTLHLVTLLANFNLNPYVTENVEDVFLCNQVYSGLVKLDQAMIEIPDLAQRWSISPDRKRYTFYLRPEARFHNGEPVTAFDVQASFEFYLRHYPRGYFAEFFKVIQGVDQFQRKSRDHISGLQALDSLTLRIDLVRPYPPFLKLLSVVEAKVLPRSVLAAGAQAIIDRATGSGPFQLVKRSKHALVLKRFPEYWMPSSRRGFKYVQVLLNKRSGERLLEENRFDLIYYLVEGYDIDFEQYNRFQFPTLSISMLNLNCRRFPTNLPAFRRALAVGMNKAALFKNLGSLEQITDYPCPLYLPRPDEGREPALPDLSRAQAMLAAIKDSLGIDSFPSLEIAADTNYFPLELYRKFSAYLDTLGLDNRLHFYQSLPWEQEREFVRKFHFSFLTWNLDLPDPQFFFDLFFKSDSPSNLTNYTDPEVDALLEKAAQTIALNQRLQLYAQVEAHIMQDLPIIPLSNIKEILYLRKNLRNISLNRLGIASLDLSSIEKFSN